MEMTFRKDQQVSAKTKPLGLVLKAAFGGQLKLKVCAIISAVNTKCKTVTVKTLVGDRNEILKSIGSPPRMIPRKDYKRQSKYGNHRLKHRCRFFSLFCKLK